MDGFKGKSTANHVCFFYHSILVYQKILQVFPQKPATTSPSVEIPLVLQWFQMVPVVQISRTLEPTPVGVGTIYAAVQLVCWGPSH